MVFIPFICYFNATLKLDAIPSSGKNMITKTTFQ